MLRGDLAPGAGRHADHERDVNWPPDMCEMRGGVVHDLVERQQAEVDGHDLDDRAHAAQRGADAGADERRLRQRRVADALAARTPRAGPCVTREAAAVAADVLAHQEHPLVAGSASRIAWRMRLAVGDVRRGSRGAPGRSGVARSGRRGRLDRLPVGRPASGERPTRVRRILGLATAAPAPARSSSLSMPRLRSAP